MKGTLLKDRDGNTSSKRFAGIIISGMGLAMLCIIGFLAIWEPVADPETAIKVGTTLLGFGAGLLGVSVLEHFGKGQAR